MKIPAIVGITACLASIALASDEPPLPAWETRQRAEREADGWLAGAVLLTDDPIPGEPERAAAEALEAPSPDEIAGDATVFPELPEKFLPDYFAERPKSFLVDPQGLLAPADYQDRLGFLNYHASDSSIDLFVYLLEKDQEIPADVRDEEMMERLFNEGRPAAVVFYYLGAPQRSVISLSPSLTGSISTTEQRRALESSVMQASERTIPAEQLEKFLGQMSVRIYWMERMLSSTLDIRPHPGAEGAAIVEKKAAAAPAPHGKFAWVKEAAAKAALPASALAGLLLAAFGLTRWLRARARHRFPELEVEPRLGGSHAAGVGAVISFSSASVPPASQRDQMPDYLRRM
ncbi:hypothetical protein JIN84_08085 [Luteolibacter yonseiensis]|uniref:DUF2167 domain-containing protein n=1 Tax=Luteolibacter yonseiensis TaxID=1144680 RepID=A0A934VAX0_9BACT|nr:hypothetical protein [Luteolibacter yonseiensis]MBK1815570.1 hypothetical protein [Luteolibacter yonseiensis]